MRSRMDATEDGLPPCSTPTQAPEQVRYHFITRELDLTWCGTCAATRYRLAGLAQRLRVACPRVGA